MLSLKFHPDAVLELEDALLWYEKISVKVLQKFKEELNIGFEKILMYPNAAQLFYKDFRRYVLRVFPYLIIYSVQEDNIFVVSVFNTSRNPDIIKRRIEIE